MIRILALLLCPTLAFSEVRQGPPNADFQPAFPEQTRAPELARTPVSTEWVARGLANPWGIAVLPSGQLLVTERDGNLRLVGQDGSVSRPLRGLPDVAARGQGGLLDVAVSPNFATDRTIFWSYSKPVSGRAVTAAAKGVLSQTGDVTEVTDIFVQTEPVRSGQHFGSRVLPQPDGTVWITTGDRGAGDSGNLVQDPNSTHGKVIRVNRDGTAPEDNPFVNGGGNDEVWSIGHRNMQGAAVDAQGRLWTIEHGPRGGDELNLPMAGANYGWPVVSYGINYRGSDVGSGQARAPGFEEPIYYWDPVIAPGGMMFYDGAFAAWRGDLLIGSLNPGALVRLKLEGGRVVGEERLITDVGRIRDVEVMRDGSVLVLVDSGNGGVLRVTPGG